MRPAIHLVADVLGGYGGVETYLDALAHRLHAEGWPMRVAVCLNGPAPFLADLEDLGISVYRQPRMPGDRWWFRQRLLIRHIAGQVRAGDWVFCVRQPMPKIYLSLVRAVHRRGGKIAASWMFAPEFIAPPAGKTGEDFKTAVRETDAVISVAHCTASQFRAVYDYDGPVHVVRLHNLELFPAVAPLPSFPPFAIGFAGRIDIAHKNLDAILDAFRHLSERRNDVILNVHGGGPDLDAFRGRVAASGLAGRVVLHGPYDHRKDLPGIVAKNHIFAHASLFEGGPCLSLIELLQAGRYVVASPVGGTPDIYEGYREIGALAPPSDPRAIADALDHGLRLLEDGALDPKRIRGRYLDEFHGSVAHRQWLKALDLQRYATPDSLVLADGEM